MPAQGDFIRIIRQRLDGTTSETLAQITRLGRKRVDLLLPGGVKAQTTRADLDGLEPVEPTDVERASLNPAPRESANVRRHSINFSDADWQQIEQLAARLNITSSEFVRYAVTLLAAQHGAALKGVPSWGGGADRELDLDRLEIKMRGLPSLADDD